MLDLSHNMVFPRTRSPEMAVSLVSRYSFASIILYCLFFAAFPFKALAAETSFSFSFERFDKNLSSHSEISLYGDAEIGGSVVRITRPVISSTGRMVYRTPIRFEGRNPGFSTYFSFSIYQGNGGVVVFSMVPNCSTPEAMNGGLSWLASSVVAVEFNTSLEPGSNDWKGDHVGINLGKHVSVVSGDLGRILNSGERLHTWVDYDGESKRIEVRLSRSNASRPSDPLISYSIDLSNVLWREAMLVGIISSTQTSASCVYSWNFATKHGVRYLKHSEPLDPQSFPVRPVEETPTRLRRNYSWTILMALVFGVACGAIVAFLVMFVWTAVVFRRPVAPVEYPDHPEEFAYEKVIFVESKGVADSKK